MRTLLDTNILLRASQPGHGQYVEAVTAPLALISGWRELCIGAQTICEFLAVHGEPSNVVQNAAACQQQQEKIAMSETLTESVRQAESGKTQDARKAIRKLIDGLKIP